ncbi:MAG: hypothetical protein ACRDHY_12225 [Anaerolineales bacterium]
MADKAVRRLRQQRALAPERPFLMYCTPGLAPGRPTAPITRCAT